MKTTPETSTAERSPLGSDSCSRSSILDGIYVEKTPHHGFEWRFPTKGMSQSMSMGEVMLWSILQELKHPMMVIEAEAPCKEPCPKCGNGGIYRKYFAKGDVRKAHIGGELKDHGTAFRTTNYVNRATRECITHHCRCCQFEWVSAPLSENEKSPDSGATEKAKS